MLGTTGTIRESIEREGERLDRARHDPTESDDPFDAFVGAGVTYEDLTGGTEFIRDTPEVSPAVEGIDPATEPAGIDPEGPAADAEIITGIRPTATNGRDEPGLLRRIAPLAALAVAGIAVMRWF